MSSIQGIRINLVYIVSLGASKKVTRENWLKLNVYLDYLRIMKLTRTPILPNGQVPNGFFGITANSSGLKKVQWQVYGINLWRSE